MVSFKALKMILKNGVNTPLAGPEPFWKPTQRGTQELGTL